MIRCCIPQTSVRIFFIFGFSWLGLSESSGQRLTTRDWFILMSSQKNNLVKNNLASHYALSMCRKLSVETSAYGMVYKVFHFFCFVFQAICLSLLSVYFLLVIESKSFYRYRLSSVSFNILEAFNPLPGLDRC